MTETIGAGCRISRVRPKHGGAVVEVLPTRPPPDDSNFVPTLIWLLDQARKGKVIGYAVLFSVETLDGNRRDIEAAKAWDRTDRHHVLGLIERWKQNYIARDWDDDESLPASC